MCINHFAGELAAAKIGILANQASLTSQRTPIVKAFFDLGLNITSLFSPEHGISGSAQAGIYVEDTYDNNLQVPVFSLYGKNKSPTDDSLDLIDVMIIDLVDVGTRHYTYIHTMARVIEACARKSKPVWVLDRPNPIPGFEPEGYLCESRDQSFFSSFPIPITHQLTIGELAKLYVEYFDVDCDLRVVKMEGWKRGMWFDETGLPWVQPSPNMPCFDTALVYPGTCLLEGVNVSEGRGTQKPFEMIGAPWIDAGKLKSKLDSYGLGGVEFSIASFAPTMSKYEGQECNGVTIKVVDRTSFRPVLAGIAIICAIAAVYPEKLDFLNGGEFFDHLNGSSKVRKAILSGVEPKDIADGWQTDISEFERITGCFRALLY